MKVVDIIHEHRKGEKLVSFEILPPLKGKSIEQLYRILDPLMEYKPPFIDVTYHREEYEYKVTPSGYFEKIAVRKRPGTVGICSAIKHKYDVEAVPHLICGGFSKEETENALIDLNFLDIQNVLALRGDARKMEKSFVAEPDGHHYAVDLVRQLDDMNKGHYLDKDLVDAVKTDFCIGVAGYPEKHFEAASYQEDLMFLKKKIDAGAHYIVTQMFFDNAAFLKFVKDCRAIGIDVPIIPGIKPITKLAQLKGIPSNFYIDFPDELVKEIRKCKNDEEVRLLGIEWCVQQSKELFANGAPCIHFYTMSDFKTVSTICTEIL
ncbi:MAG TPA: methylenetetrahydrofolate reductase [NAD(P)H] [Chitinophagales bacterium]|nr:methylenetetrahydrofolate reductase [NAD(P)H] [Chitinophagales bacterium]